MPSPELPWRAAPPSDKPLPGLQLPQVIASDGANCLGVAVRRSAIVGALTLVLAIVGMLLAAPFDGVPAAENGRLLMESVDAGLAVYFWIAVQMWFLADLACQQIPRLRVWALSTVRIALTRARMAPPRRIGLRGGVSESGKPASTRRWLRRIGYDDDLKDALSLPLFLWATAVRWSAGQDERAAEALERQMEVWSSDFESSASSAGDRAEDVLGATRQVRRDLHDHAYLQRAVLQATISMSAQAHDLGSLRWGFTVWLRTMNSHLAARGLAVVGAEACDGVDVAEIRDEAIRALGTPSLACLRLAPRQARTTTMLVALVPRASETESTLRLQLMTARAARSVADPRRPTVEWDRQIDHLVSRLEDFPTPLLAVDGAQQREAASTQEAAQYQAAIETLGHILRYSVKHAWSNVVPASGSTVVGQVVRRINGRKYGGDQYAAIHAGHATKVTGRSMTELLVCLKPVLQCDHADEVPLACEFRPQMKGRMRHAQQVACFIVDPAALSEAIDGLGLSMEEGVMVDRLMGTGKQARQAARQMGLTLAPSPRRSTMTP